MVASLDLDRKQLAWQRREDWRSHPQLAHRLEVNRLVTDLIAATLLDPTLGLAAWFGPRQAAARMGEKMRGTLRPDAELILTTPAGPIDLLLEWDRGTETTASSATRFAHCQVQWAHLGSNQGPLACEASALPLSYAPGRAANLPA